MIATLIPGYQDLFGARDISYHDLLRNISSDTVIMLLISLNAELNSDESHQANQKRLLEVVTLRYTATQISDLKTRLANFKAKTQGYDGTLFGRRYLLSMILKELERKNENSIDQNDPMHEYNFLLAYLIIVDEVNEKDHTLLDEAKKYTLPIMPVMPLLWASNINQYEYNDRTNLAFEFYKLLSFCKYAYDNHKAFLKELINRYKFSNISQFIGSFNQVVKSTMTYQPNEFLRKLYFIVPKKEIDYSHLNSQCINNIIDLNKSSVADLKKFPLYKTQERGIMVIDEDMYRKKVYRGPLFELNKETGLSNKMKFEDYKTEVSKKCFEEILFKGIVRQLMNEPSIVHFDSGNSIGEPDIYYRVGNDIFLVEFKDYLFPDTLITGTSFGAYKKYINERFLSSDRAKSKGVSQLTNCINNLFSKKYEFDSDLNEKIDKRERINVYPFICHTDFIFSMPGLNEYLNHLFVKQLREKKCSYDGVNKITLINLDALFDLALRGGDFAKLLSFVRRYYDKINLMREKASASLSIDDFVPSTASFDEWYITRFRSEMIDKGELTNNDRTSRMSSIIGISQEQLDEIL